MQSIGPRLTSASLAAVVVAGVVGIIPADRVEAPMGTPQVQIHAVLLSAVTNSSALDAGWGASSSGSTDAPTGNAVAPVPAAATPEESIWDTPLGQVLLFANLLVLPLWFLATPITLPLSMFAAVSQIPEDDPLSSLKFLVLTALGFLTGPLGVFDIITRPMPAASVRASAAMSPNSADVRGGQNGGASYTAPPSATSPAVNTSVSASNSTATIPAAAATEDTATIIGRFALTVVGLLTAPIWYLATPITLPLTIATLFARTGVDPFGPSNYFSAIAVPAIFGLGFAAWAAYPLALPYVFFPPATTEAEVAPSPSRLAASSIPVTPANSSPAQANGPAADEAEAVLAEAGNSDPSNPRQLARKQTRTAETAQPSSSTVSVASAAANSGDDVTAQTADANSPVEGKRGAERASGNADTREARTPSR